MSRDPPVNEPRELNAVGLFFKAKTSDGDVLVSVFFFLRFESVKLCICYHCCSFCLLLSRLFSVSVQLLCVLVLCQQEKITIF